MHATHIFPGPPTTRSALAHLPCFLPVSGSRWYPKLRARMLYTNEIVVNSFIAAEQQVASAETTVYSCIDFAPPSTHTLNFAVFVIIS